MKYSEVLIKYETELKNNRILFNRYKDILSVAKHQPFVTGQIDWGL